jgi:hypothetical protein
MNFRRVCEGPAEARGRCWWQNGTFFIFNCSQQQLPPHFLYYLFRLLLIKPVSCQNGHWTESGEDGRKNCWEDWDGWSWSVGVKRVRNLWVGLDWGDCLLMFGSLEWKWMLTFKVWKNMVGNDGWIWMDCFCIGKLQRDASKKCLHRHD